jgi:hypothetical protein
MATRGNKRPARHVLGKPFSAAAKFGSNIQRMETRGNVSRVDAMESLSSLFEPDILSPSQYLDTFHRKTLIEPEKKLMMAILEDAIHCFQDNILFDSGKRKKLFDDAEAWFFDESTDWLFSFINVSELLGLDPRYLRAGLLRWRKRQLAQEAGRRVIEALKMAG